MKPSEWSQPEFESLVGELVRVRKIFADTLHNMTVAEDGMLRGMFTRFQTQLERYFELENLLMERSEYPDQEAHRREHDAMLLEIRYFKERVENGLFSLGHTYVRVRLPQWFLDHTEKHDQELANHLGMTRLAINAAA